jgi:hypothetical protein
VDEHRGRTEVGTGIGELANSRLAMAAIRDMLFQKGTFDTTGPEMWSIKLPEYANSDQQGDGSAWHFAVPHRMRDVCLRFLSPSFCC